MKKLSLFLTLIVVSLFLSTIQAAPVDSLTAKNLARNYWGTVSKTSTKAIQNLPAEIVYCAMTEADTRSGQDETSSVCYYIINVGQNGFVIMAGDDRITPILGYSTESSFKTNGMPENVRGWLENLRNKISYALNWEGLTETPQITYRWNHLAEMAAARSVVVEPLIQTTWSQDGYYNQYCPTDTNGPNGHAYVGCVATAMAQIIRYWQWPQSGFNSNNYTADYGTLSLDFSTATYDYDSMPNSIDSGSSATQIDAVATLSYHCGISVNMDYGPDGSGAFSQRVPQSLTNFFAYPSGIVQLKKAHYTSANWDYILQNELNNGRPVQYSGSGAEGGHSFVCDGYDSDGFYHFNWGWSGCWDGYFNVDSLCPGFDLSEYQAAIVGIDASGSFIRCSNNVLMFAVPSGGTGEVMKVDVRGHSLSDSIHVISSGGFLIGASDSTTAPMVSLPPQGGTFYAKYSPSLATQAQNTENGIITLNSGNVNDTVFCFASVYEEICFSPQELSGARQDSIVNLSWSEPVHYGINPDVVVISQDSSFPHVFWSQGANRTLCMVQRFDVNDLAPYHQYLLKSISFVPAKDGTSFRLVAYKGGQYENGLFNSGTQIVNQEIPDIALLRDIWNTVPLDVPLIVDATEELWIGFVVYTTGNEGSVLVITDSCEEHKGGIMWQANGYEDGTVNHYWHDYCTNHGNFPIKGELEPLSADVVRYDIYRNDEQIGSTTNTDFIDENPPLTSCDYAVYAVWDNDCSQNAVVTLPSIVSVPTIPESDGSLFMTLYPNPTTDIVLVQLSEWAVSSKAEIQLFDMYGKLLRSVPVTGETTQLDFTQYASGLYFVKAVSNGQVVAVQKAVRR